ncbi:crossover junction endodeoxyribonuclease RuvC [Halomonas chromatireducens]|uniref:crossover junction endodeoxyribonuclease RuvC n=1 Tax=Halomonas chromatireducens TaxID=507626 RepID=UPI003AAC886E
MPQKLHPLPAPLPMRKTQRALLPVRIDLANTTMDRQGRRHIQVEEMEDGTLRQARQIDLAQVGQAVELQVQVVLPTTAAQIQDFQCWIVVQVQGAQPQFIQHETAPLVGIAGRAMQGDDLAQRLAQAYAGISELIALHRPGEFAIEQVFMSKNAISPACRKRYRRDGSL